MTRCQIVLPARLASSRLPEKLLRRVGGKCLLQHTFEAASRAKIAQGIVIAVDDERIAREAEAFGGRWIMTSPTCSSGTDRIAEVAESMSDVEVFVNVQSDEPEIDPQVIDRVATLLLNDPQADLATAGTPIRERHLLDDPACVKIVMADSDSLFTESLVPTTDRQTMSGQGRAVYFSRAAVPFVRDGITDSHLAAEPPLFWHHIGIYAYRRSFLEWFASAPPSRLEQAERLEQLRALEAGKRIVVARVEAATPGIDTQADLDAFIKRMSARQSSSG